MGCGCKGKKEETVQPANIRPEPIKLPAELDVIEPITLTEEQINENINTTNNGQ
jgi:hypothetical protein